MSWDVFIMRYPVEVEDPSDIPSDGEPSSLGTHRQVREVLTMLLPGITFAPDGWIDYDGPGISFNAQVDDDDEPSTCLALFIYGTGPAAARIALTIAEALNARAFATGVADFLTPDNVESAADGWLSYRDRVLEE